MTPSVISSNYIGELITSGNEQQLRQFHKLLIYWPVDKIKPTGGPAGYLNNLRHGLESIGVSNYSFLPAIGARLNDNKLLQRLVPERIKDRRRLNHFICMPSAHKTPAVDLDEYQIVHFHSTEDLYLCRGALETYSGTVLLTSHSPCVYHKEVISRLNSRDAERYVSELARLEIMDKYAFNRADYVIFPCEEAEEPYFHTWSNYGRVRDPSKLRYVPTGIHSCTAKSERQEVRKRLNIPLDAFVMCYVGRHSEIKGYKTLIELIPGILDRENMWMLVAGKEGPLFHPNHKRWIEVGWTDDPHSLIAASDLFVLPNQETYFDLIMLEVLSLGVPIVASKTGGNKYFEKFESRGIVLYEDRDQLINAIEAFRLKSNDEKLKAARDNINLFEREFTCERFAERYTALIDAIGSEVMK